MKSHIKFKTHLRRMFLMTTVTHFDFPFKSGYDREKMTNAKKLPPYKAWARNWGTNVRPVIRPNNHGIEKRVNLLKSLAKQECYPELERR